jgi:hypothetical protein
MLEVFMAKKSTGNCYVCGASLDRAAMGKHLLESHGGDGGTQECCLLNIEGLYNKDYWLYVDVPVEKTLSTSNLDSFLRKIWLECCGHLSEFYVDDHNEIAMSQKLNSFAAGDKFFYSYDFGDTTELEITVIGRIMRKPQKGPVRLLARNAPPVFECAACGKPSHYICIEYVEPFENKFYCMNCAEKHEDDDHPMLPVTNSPRMGVCAYDGELDTFEFNSLKFKGASK